MTRWLRTLLRALWLIVIGDYAAIRQPKQDEMDRLMQDAREAGLMHGEVGRDFLILNEMHQEAKWRGRAGTPIIVATVLLVILVLLHVPTPAFVAGPILGIAGFMSLVRIGIGLGHDFRWMAIQWGPPPSEPTAPSEPTNLSAAPPDAGAMETPQPRIQALQPQEFHERAYWWNLNAVHKVSIASPLPPEACRAALTTIIEPASGEWYEASQRLALGSPLRKRAVQVTVKHNAFSLDSEWRAGMSAISDGLVLTGSLQPSPRGGTLIQIEVAGHSMRLIASVVALPVFVLLIAGAVTGYPSHGLMTLLAVGFLALWAYGYYVASASVGADALFLVAALRQAVQAPEDEGATSAPARDDCRGGGAPPATGCEAESAQ